MSDPPKPLVDMNRAFSHLFGPSNSFNQSTWIMDPIKAEELVEATGTESLEKLWSSVIVDNLTTPVTAWPEDSREKELDARQAEQVQRLFRAFNRPLVERKVMDREEINNISLSLKQVMEADPPPKSNWEYSTYIAKKNIVVQG